MKEPEEKLKEKILLEEEIVRLSKLVVQKVKESREVRDRLEVALLENEKRRVELEERVKKRTEELQQKVEELEKFQKLAVGREIKMIELKEEIKKLKGRE